MIYAPGNPLRFAPAPHNVPELVAAVAAAAHPLHHSPQQQDKPNRDKPRQHHPNQRLTSKRKCWQ